MTGRGAVLLGTFGAALAVSAALSADERSTTPPQGLRRQDPQVYAFTGATLVIRPGLVVPEATLVVREGRVVAAGAEAKVPSDAEVVDLAGRWIFPGLIDPYTEYGLGHVAALYAERPDPAPPQYEGSRVGANAWNDAIHAERDWIDEFKPDAKAAEPWLERGYAVVQSAKLDGIFRGRSFVTTLAAGVPNEVVVRPRSLHFASFDRGTSRQAYPASLMGSIALIRQTLLDAAWYAQAEAAAAREGSLAAPEFNRAIEALAANEEPIVFAADDVHSLLRAARIGEELGVPLIHVGSNTEYPRLDEVAALGEPVILPLDWPEAPPLGSVEDERAVMLSDLRRWERAPHHPAALHEAGVEIAFTAHGLEEADDLFERVRRAIRRGLPAEAALAALTTTPAELCGIADEAGTLEPGRAAHFFVADRDLLAERGDVLAVWIAGRRAFDLFPAGLADFRGVWRFTFEGQDYELRVKGGLRKPQGKLVQGERDLDVAGLGTSPSGLDFHAALEQPGPSGVVRFHLSLPEGPGQVVPGHATLPDGRRVPLSFERTGSAEAAGDDDDAPDEDREKDPEAETAEELALVSRRTFPDSPFGFEERPVARDVLVRDATIWTLGDEGVWEGGDLLVRDGRIVAVDQDIDAPAGALVIDGTGRHVTPGIIDEHSHIAIAGNVNEGSHAITAEVRIGDVLDAEDVAIYRALAGGVTAAQLLHGSANPIGGQAQVIKLRWGQPPEDLKLEGVTPTIKFALGENVKQSNWGEQYTLRYPQTRMGVEALMRDAFLAARAYRQRIEAGARRRTLPPRRDLQLEALAEVLEGERLVHCHSYVQSEILSLMRLAESLDFRIATFTHILEGYKVAGEMAAHGASASSFADWWAYKFEVYDAIPYNICLLAERGVISSVNSDSAEVIRRLNQEAAKSVHYCGMGDSDALALATLNPARQLRIDDRVGSLTPGKDADFVIWDGHPLSVRSKVLETWIEGVPYFSAERDAELGEAARRERAALVQKALSSTLDKKSDKDEDKP